MMHFIHLRYMPKDLFSFFSRCVVPGCDDNSTQFNEDFVNWTIPEGDKCNYWKPVNNESMSADQCSRDDFMETEKVNCSQWVYDTSLFTSTTVTEVGSPYVPNITSRCSSHFTIQYVCSV